VRQGLFNNPGRFNKINRIIIMLINASGDCKNIRVKNNVFRREANLLG